MIVVHRACDHQCAVVRELRSYTALRIAIGVLLILMFALYLLGGTIATYAIVSTTGVWLPASVAGFAWSKYRRQCEDRAELEQSLPIARVR